MAKEKKPQLGRTERLAEIAKEWFLRAGKVPIDELATRFDITERMVRDDILAIGAELWKEGGQARLRRAADFHQLQRMMFPALKADLAAKVISLLNTPYVSTSVGPGTTAALSVAEMIVRNFPAQIVTNSLAVCELSPPPSIPVHLTGGTYAPGIHALVGEAAQASFARLKTRVGVLGVSAIDDKGNIYVHHDTEYPVLQAMLNSISDCVYIVADIVKLAVSDTWHVARLHDLATVDDHSRDVVLVTNEVTKEVERLLKTRASRAQEVLTRLESLARTKGNFRVVHAPRNKDERRAISLLVPWMGTLTDYEDEA